MSFLPAARSEIAKRHENDPIRITLEYLLEHAVGSANAVSIDTVVAHINNLGIKMPRQAFQHSVLSQSRSSGWFIGSGNTGIFLIENEADASVMKQFYEDRIASEQKHLEQLLSESRLVGWEI